MSNANSNKRPKINTIPVSTEGIDELFQQPEIAAKYQSIRESDEIEGKYLEMMESVITSSMNVGIDDILKDPVTREKNEESIKEMILITALRNLVKDGKGDIQGAVLSVITTENILEYIKLREKAWEDTIKDIAEIQKITKGLFGAMFVQ